MVRIILMSVICLFFASPLWATDFSYDITRNAVPTPPAETGLQTATAAEYFRVTPERHTLEGAIFDDRGNLLFCDPTAKRIYRLTPKQELELVVEMDRFAPSGLALSGDGRLFFTALDLAGGEGQILALGQDGTTLETIIPISAGYLPNDLVFDRNGGFYFTDFRGTSTERTGGVYHASPDGSNIRPVLPHLSQANGIALSPDGKVLWVTEYAANRLHRLVLDGPTNIPPTGFKVVYNFIGPAPDSMRVDREGNVYVAMVGLGKVMIFNANGLPIGQVMLPERDLGNNLRSTSLALHPAAPEMYIVAGNTQEAPASSTGIFRGPAFAPGLPVVAQPPK